MKVNSNLLNLRQTPLALVAAEEEGAANGRRSAGRNRWMLEVERAVVAVARS
jgi:hypothetical protein